MVSFQINLLQEPGNHTFALKIPSRATYDIGFPGSCSGPTLGSPNTSSTIAMALLGRPGENVPKVGTILPLPYQPLTLVFQISMVCHQSIYPGLPNYHGPPHRIYPGIPNYPGLPSSLVKPHLLRYTDPPIPVTSHSPVYIDEDVPVTSHSPVYIDEDVPVTSNSPVYI